MRHRIADVRNRWLARPSVRSFLGTIWPFRLIARRQARRLFDISAGFVYSRVLMTCLELDWFAQLRHGPVALAELADKADLNVDAAERLMLAACALDLMEPRGHGQFALGPLGAALIGDEGIAAMATHHRMFYTDMADTLALLRDRSNTQLARYWAYATSDSPASLSPTDVSDYTELMAASQPMIAEQVLATFKFGGFSHLVDVGGGKGAFASAVGARYPSLRLSVLDLPAVVARIPDDANIQAIGGSFLETAIPESADIVSLVRILHDHDDETVLGLLSNLRRNIGENATLVIAEPMAETRGAEVVGHAYFGFYLWAMGSGRARNQSEIDAMLVEAGFAPSRRLKTPVPLICSVLLTNPV